MRNFQHKRDWRDIMQSRPVLVFLIVLVFIFAWSVFGFMGKMKVTIENKKIAENQAIELKEKKDKLLSDITKLKTENGVEESIRTKFGLAKEGEGLIVIVDDKNPPEVPKQEPSGFFSFWKNLFE